MARTPKTNAARVLDDLGIEYELKTYEVDPRDLSAYSVARKVGLPVGQLYKTLVVRGLDHGVALAVVAGDEELSLKALARLSGDRKVALVPLAEVQPLTGYVRGGVTALATSRDFSVYLDESAFRHDTISVSAGRRGVQILLSPGDYARAVSAKLGNIARPASAK